MTLFNRVTANLDVRIELEVPVNEIIDPDDDLTPAQVEAAVREAVQNSPGRFLVYATDLPEVEVELA